MISKAWALPRDHVSGKSCWPWKRPSSKDGYRIAKAPLSMRGRSGSLEFVGQPLFIPSPREGLADRVWGAGGILRSTGQAGAGRDNREWLAYKAQRTQGIFEAADRSYALRGQA